MSSTGAPLGQTTQLWKTWDEKANKHGPRKTVFWVSGEQYRGEWVGNKKHGKGTMVYRNADKYEGDWEEDFRSGLGVYWVYDNGRYKVRYNGVWASDLPHGEGVLFSEDGDVYQGEFQNGMRHGKGKQTYGGRADGFGGDIYEGWWDNDKRHGRGTLALANGDIFEGTWSNDQREGPGTFYFMSENKRYDGVWKEDRPRCGEYSEIEDTGPGSRTALPVLELAEWRKVIDKARDGVLRTVEGGARSP
ncbi:unnamed protein product [Pedinophyceae sp. YPF-701]|nr:unnamed protein product [Pedinophyceae sp. YPF-701]